MNSRIAPFEALAQRALPVARMPDADAIDVRGLLRTFWKARLRIAGVAFACGLLVFLLISLITPTFTAYSKVMLDPRKAQIITSNQLLSDLDASEPVVNGELAVLRSNLLLEKVIAASDPAFLDRIDPALKPKSMMSRVKSGVKWAVTFGGTADAPVDAETAAAQRIERLVGTMRGMLTVYNEPSSYVMVIKAQSAEPVVAQRLANAVAEATDDTDDSLIKGGYWYRKYYAEEEDALRSTITLDELHNSTFSMKLWFQSQLYPDMKRIKGAIASGLDWRSLSDTARFDLPSGTMLGMSKRTNGTPFFINDDGSIINIRKSFETGTHPQFSLYVHRREDRGWELRSQTYVLRSVEDRSIIDGLWTNYTSSLTIEKRKKGVLCTRRGSGIKYKRREVPDIEEIKEFLTW